AGLCLPIALPHRTFIALKPRTDGIVRVVSDVDPTSFQEVDLNGLEARGVDGWAAYPVGVAWALRSMGFSQVQGFDAAFASCVPLGSGLSSSAAMTCSTALALDDVFALGYGASDAGRVTLIESAMKSENDMAGASTGGLDQNASMRCTAGHALLLDCRPELTPLENTSQQPFDLSAHGLELLVVDTQAPHQLNDGQYAERRACCEEAAKVLKVANLRVTADGIAKSDDPFQSLKETLDALPDEVMKKRVRHVVTEIARVRSFVRAFANGQVEEAGRLFNASHDSLKADYEVTVPELDVAVDVARKNGAYGARMTGGGFGGSIIALVNSGESEKLAQLIADEFARQGFHAPRALAAVASDSARKVR
ncbi:MAG: galactokinase, partial [Bifidobacterium crudilactis]|nr:galactokinase [Bifidobacterium crudilactis]